MRNNRKTKVKLILKCNMERQTYSGRVIQPSAFHSGIENNLDGTGEKELYETMVERMIEKKWLRFNLWVVGGDCIVLSD